LAGLNPELLLALTCIDFPVWGLRPVLALRDLNENVTNVG